jgi:hypothetical protein
MCRKAPVCILLTLGLLTAPLSADAQRHRKANLNEDVPLPVDFAIDYQLGLTALSRRV